MLHVPCLATYLYSRGSHRRRFPSRSWRRYLPFLSHTYINRRGRLRPPASHHPAQCSALLPTRKSSPSRPQPNEQKLNINLRCWPLPDILLEEVPYSFSHILFLKHLYIPEYSLYSGRTPPIFRNIPVFLFKKWSPKRIWNMKNIWQRPTPVLSRLLLRARRAAKRLPGSGA